MNTFKNGQALNAPERKYQNAEDVFRKETREEYKKKYPNMEAAKEAQKADWLALSERQKEIYTKLYVQSVNQYKKDLAKINGGSKKEGAAQQEGNIPPKPKHGLNGYFIYLGEQREEYTKQHPNMSPSEITKGLSEMYNTLSDEQKNHYKQKAKKQAEVQDKLIEKWEEQYGDQIKEEKKKQKELRKYNSDGQKKDISYQEILSKKEKRKLVPLGNDVTKQEGKERGRPKKSEQGQASKSPLEDSKFQQEQDQKVQGKERGRSKKSEQGQASKPPLENSKVQQEQDQKVQGKGRPKKSEEHKDRRSLSRSSLDEKVQGRGKPKKQIE
ncbi:high mobility group box 3 [Paramecium bursaria]